MAVSSSHAEYSCRSRWRSRGRNWITRVPVPIRALPLCYPTRRGYSFGTGKRKTTSCEHKRVCSCLPACLGAGYCRASGIGAGVTHHIEGYRSRGVPSSNLGGCTGSRELSLTKELSQLLKDMEFFWISFSGIYVALLLFHAAWCLFSGIALPRGW